jgi:mono/diheme cytochrome c family protein
VSRTNLFIVLAAVVLTALGAFYYLGQKPVQSASLRQPEASDPIAGAALYADNCSACHGANLEGQENWQSPNEDGTLPAPPHDDTGHTWHHGDALLFNYTKHGGEALLAKMGVTDVKSGMPAFGDQLSDAEIWDILAYIKSSWPTRVRDIQKQRSDAEQLRDGG